MLNDGVDSGLCTWTLHEYVYAARYLPFWRHGPDRALPALREEGR